MSDTIVFNIKLDKLKIVTFVKLLGLKNKKPVPYDAVVDTGSSYTAMSEQLFKDLEYTEQEKVPATITGINGKSEGFSTVIDDFILGGVNLGKTRVTISKFQPEFENVIILGMNVLAWFNMLVSYSKGEITLAERKIKNIDKDTRFNRTDIFTKNILINEMALEDEE
jgi:predicted aspartyl protease